MTKEVWSLRHQHITNTYVTAISSSTFTNHSHTHAHTGSSLWVGHESLHDGLQLPLDERRSDPQDLVLSLRAALPHNDIVLPLRLGTAPPPSSPEALVVESLCQGEALSEFTQHPARSCDWLAAA